MTAAALVTGNTVVIKPSSEAPTVGAIFAETLLEAGFPARAFSFLTGSGGVIGDTLVEHPRRASCRSPDRATWVFALMNWPPGRGKARSGSSAWSPRWAVRTRSSWMRMPTSTLRSKASPLPHSVIRDKSVRPARAPSFTKTCTTVPRKAEGPRKTHHVGAPDDPANYIGPVISAGAKKTILDYIETGKKEGRLLTGGTPGPTDGYFIQPTVIADVDSKARIFQEEIFGPVLAVTQARDFDHALEMANDSQYGLTGAIYSKDPAHINARATNFLSGTCTSTGSARAQWWARTRSAGSTCRERIRRRAGRITCCFSCRRSRSAISCSPRANL